MKFLAILMTLAWASVSHAQDLDGSLEVPAPTWTAPPPPTHIERQSLRLEVLEGEEAPRALPLVMKKGWLNAALPPSDALGIRLTNVGDGRLLVVVAINGLDPSTGKRAYQGQPGRVLLPGQALVISKGKAHKKAEVTALLPAGKTEGAISVAVFHERTDYPLLLPHMDPPPFGPEHFTVGRDGIRRWVPPPRYPFRKASINPAEMLYLQYSADPALAQAGGQSPDLLPR